MNIDVLGGCGKMKIIIFKYDDDIVLPNGVVLCLGFFDGVHLGHKTLIERAKTKGEHVGILTFDKSPKAYLLGRREEGVTSLSDKANYFDKLGVEYLFVLEFDERLSKLSKLQFKELVIDRFKPICLIMGEDYRFGFSKEGGPGFLRQFYPIEVVPILKIGDKKVSSRDISLLIKDGDIKEANKLLGHPYLIGGTVEKGLGNGHKINFPTANIKLDYDYTFPKEGVYMSYAYINDVKYLAITSISTHPTIDILQKPIIEVHIINFDGDLYGRYIEVEFIDYIRPIYKFNDLDELKTQIEKDENLTKNALKIE